MSKRIVLTLAIVSCLCGAAQAVQDKEPAVTSGEVMGKEMVMNQGSTDQPSQDKEQKKIKAQATVEVIEPQPIFTPDEKVVDDRSAAPRNPFSEELIDDAPIPDKEYLTVAEQCILRGIIKVGGQQMVLLQLPVDNAKQGNAGSGGKLRRYAQGDRIMIVDGPQEFNFTLMALDNRSVVLQGENDEGYTLWL